MTVDLRAPQIKVRVVRGVHYDHQRRRPGELIKVERVQFENERGEFECPNWAVLVEPQPRREPAEEHA